MIILNHYFTFRRGPNRWRDSFLPKDILDDWITGRGLHPAEWDLESKPISVTVNGDSHKLPGKAKQITVLCLSGIRMKEVVKLFHLCHIIAIAILDPKDFP